MTIRFHKIIIIFALLFVLAFLSYYFAPKFLINNCHNIISIDSFVQVQKSLDKADQNTLVLFDVDETLIIPASITMRTKTKEQYQQWLKQTIENIPMLLPKEEYYFNFWAINETPLLIEPIIATMIEALQNRGVRVLAL